MNHESDLPEKSDEEPGARSGRRAARPARHDNGMPRVSPGMSGSDRRLRSAMERARKECCRCGYHTAAAGASIYGDFLRASTSGHVTPDGAREIAANICDTLMMIKNDGRGGAKTGKGARKARDIYLREIDEILRSTPGAEPE